MSKKAHVLVRLTKIDTVQRLVYGTITSESVDKSKERMDYATSKPYFEKWTGTISKATQGKSLGNLRAMHQPVAAGKLTAMDFDDDAQIIDVCAKVVDDAEWQKVEEGVYTGFSIGGSYVKRWDDPDEPGVKRFTVNPVEVSLVDNPCNPDAHFTAIKMDGTTEERHFKAKEANTMYEPTNEEVADRAAELAKAADDGSDWMSHIEAATAALKSEHVEGPAEEPAAAAEEPAEGGEAEAAGDDTEKVASEPSGAAKPKPGKKPGDAPKPDTEAPGSDMDTKEGESDAAGDKSGKRKPKKAAELTDEDRANLSETSLEQVWKTADGQTFKKKDEALEHAAKAAGLIEEEVDPVKVALEAARKAATGEATPETTEVAPVQELAPGLAKAIETYDAVRAVWEGRKDGLVEKGLYEVSALARQIAELRWICSSSIYEAAYEKDGSKVPGQLMDGLRTLGAALADMAQEEVAEMIADLQTSGVQVAIFEAEDAALVVELSAEPEGVIKVSAAMLEKIGARNSRGDQSRVQKLHDTSVELGALCDPSTGKLIGSDEDLQKLADGNPVIKALLDERNDMKTEITTTKAQVTEAVEGIGELTKTIGTMREQIEKFGKQPAPMAPKTNVVVKGAEITIEGDGPIDKDSALKAVGELMKTEAGRSMLADAAIRASQTQPHTLA